MPADSFIPTIGLEVHVQLNSKTKIFCSCEVKFGSPANSQVCPVCLGLPGVLPVLNREVFRLGLRAVLALGGTPSQLVKFDRKNYYYPDLPKGYQISQYDAPLGRGGVIELEWEGKPRRVRIHRLHLEEDAGKLLHDQSPDASHVDLNRAGTPLAEIVSEPDIDSPALAYEYLVALKAILKAVGVSDCDMEKGHLRCDANVSVRKKGSDPLGKKVEIKNLNSFKAVKAALEYEIKRQSEALEKGEPIVQETRLWDDNRASTHSMRSKEEAHDYRYFPEPDLVPFFKSQKEIEEIRRSLPELPRQKLARFRDQYQLSPYDAGLIVQDADVAALFEETAKLVGDAKTVANWIIGPVFAHLAGRLELKGTKLSATALAELCGLVREGKVSFQAAKDKMFPLVAAEGRKPEIVMKELGLEQVSDDSALDGWIAEVVAANEKVMSDVKSGKDSAVMFLVGQVMRKSGGKANPGRVQEKLRKKLCGT